MADGLMTLDLEQVEKCGITHRTEMAVAAPMSSPESNRRQADYLKTKDAAEYLGRSVSWLLRQPDVPYLKGIPNIYARKDLDSWFERNKYSARIAR